MNKKGMLVSDIMFGMIILLVLAIVLPILVGVVASEKISLTEQGNTAGADVMDQVTQTLQILDKGSILFVAGVGAVVSFLMYYLRPNPIFIIILLISAGVGIYVMAMLSNEYVDSVVPMDVISESIDSVPYTGVIINNLPIIFLGLVILGLVALTIKSGVVS